MRHITIPIVYNNYYIQRMTDRGREFFSFTFLSLFFHLAGIMIQACTNIIPSYDYKQTNNIIPSHTKILLIMGFPVKFYKFCGCKQVGLAFLLKII
jgi:hypothetical protein